MKCTVPGVTIFSATGVELTLQMIERDILGLLVNSMETEQCSEEKNLITIKTMENLENTISGMVTQTQTKFTVVMFNMHSSVKSKH
ncbi:MAG: hypothetical protein ACKO96_37450 [Flammeovirgaceae bacterium]